MGVNMKISDVFQSTLDENELSNMQKEVMAFFKKHHGEVFPYKDEQLFKELSQINPNAIEWSMWSLNKKGLLAKYKVKNTTKTRHKIFFGLPEDIKKLQNEDEKLLKKEEKGDIH